MKALLLTLLLSVSNLVVQVDWVVERPRDWGSFYWKVNRTTYPASNGFYYYYVYFYSNSLLLDGNGKTVRATTYINNVNVQMIDDLGNNVIVNLPYVLCDYKFDAGVYNAYFYTKSPNARFNINYNKITAYDYAY